ncbi:MAG: S8 family serine peptidase [Chloroflexota bacterium]
MRRLLRRFILIVALASLSGVRTSAAALPEWQTKVDSWVLQSSAEGETEFLVFLKEQAEISAAGALQTKGEKGAYVFNQLTTVARQSQTPILLALVPLGVESRPYWIVNMIWVRGDICIVQAMAQRRDVSHIFANPSVKVPSPIDNQAPSIASPSAVEWNIALVKAPQVWAGGYTGQGVVIGGQDTGYDWDHPALMPQYRGWDGVSVDHNYNWYDAIHENNPNTPVGNPCGYESSEPCDDHGHGTHTMGIMVGDDGAGEQIGMAPGAKWIGCRNMEEGWGTPATYAECFQWFLAPTDLNGQNPDPSKAPHVINNSWACPPIEGCTDPLVLQMIVANVRAAGIVVVASAGNNGPDCSSLSDPPAIYSEALTVGATNISDLIAPFSSRGPVTVDGSNRLKPEVTAPGVNIRSSKVGGGYGVSSGTSMAAPHVSGLVALLLSADPGMIGDVEAIESLVKESAVRLYTDEGCGGDSPTSHPNHTFGYGRVDALAAVQNLPHGMEISKVASSVRIAPGDLITYTLTITNTHPADITNHVLITDVIPKNTAYYTATLPHTFDGSVVTWMFENLGAGSSQDVQLVVRVYDSATGVIVNDDYAVTRDEIWRVTGAPVTTFIEIFFYFPLVIGPP